MVQCFGLGVECGHRKKDFCRHQRAPISLETSCGHCPMPVGGRQRCRSIGGASPSRRSKLWLGSNRSCRRGFRWNGMNTGLGAGLIEGSGGCGLGRRVENKAENIA